MPVCPVCDRSLEVDETSLAHHVNAHFEDSLATPVTAINPNQHEKQEKRKYGTGRSTPPSSREPDVNMCFLCGEPLDWMDIHERQNHVNRCIDGMRGERDGVRTEGDEDRDYDDSDEALRAAGQGPEETWTEDGWDGPARPGGWFDWVDRKVDRGDKWWDPVEGSSLAKDIPPNYSPGVVPVLTGILGLLVQQGITRSATLCRPVVHIKASWGFDMGWGCGYRNALMVLSALLISQPAYRLLFSRNIIGSDPGVRRIQGFIEEGWGNGYDRLGRNQLKGKVLGTRKWIGTSDLYAMFTARGIPCEVYDFPKTEYAASDAAPAHIALQHWVKDYFSGKDAPRPSAETSKSAFDVIMRKAEDDVGRGEAVRMSKRFPLILQHAGHSRTIIGYEENAAGNINLLLLDPGKTMPKDIRAAGIDTLHGTDQRHYRPTSPVKAIVYFRANLGSLSTPTSYQLLAFTGGPILTEQERALRKTISSTVVR